MKFAIVYMSKHGTTEKVAQKIAEQIDSNVVDLVNLKENKSPDISKYDKILIGGSIHAGMLQKRVATFCNKNEQTLLEKELGLFLCCMEQDDKAKEQFESAFPEDIKKHAKAKALMGGEFIFEKMNFFEKAIIKKISGVKETTSSINEDAVQEFARTMK